MKQIILIIFISVIFQHYTISQEEPVNWKISQVKNRDNSFTINITAEIKNEWYIYGMIIEEGGPLPLIIYIENAKDNLISFNAEEKSKPDIIYDEVFEMNVSTHSGTVDFAYSFTPNDNISELSLIIDGQACNKVNGICTQVYKNIPIKIN